MDLTADQRACFEIVQKGDPDRFVALMAMPVSMRVTLAPLYAFNVEVARAPWVSQEPMIGEMRLQWWRDVLEEIAQGQAVRRHEVATPLADLLDKEAAQALDQGLEARRWDLYKDPFEGAAAFSAHLEATSGQLLWQSARLTGVDADYETAVLSLGRAHGLCNWLIAVPVLEKAGRVPLVDGRAEGILALTEAALADLKAHNLPKHPSLLPAWQTSALLCQIRQNPLRVGEGAIGLSEFRKRLSLLRASVFGV